MMPDRTGTDLPLDVSSRIEALFSLVSEIGIRVSASPVLTTLLRDFQEMAKQYILLFEAQLKSGSMQPREKWLVQHEMLDKLTREWQLVYSLACAVELGSDHLSQFLPYVDQAAEDIGLAGSDADLLLIPVFGESFSLVKVSYSSSNIAILNLPISVIHSPWELSVIWHEMAGLKVIQIRDQIKKFLDAYAKEHNLVIPANEIPPGVNLIAELFDRILNGKNIDKELKAGIRNFLSKKDAAGHEQVDIWSQDWFEQLYEDACSVFAFGADFVDVLEKILSRQARKLTADRKHPDLETRLQVARRLLALQKGNAPAPSVDAERLTDNLLWAFINQMKSDPVASLPVAYASPANRTELRQKLISDMQEFNRNFGNLEEGMINTERFDFGAMSTFAQKASQTPERYVSEIDRNTRVSAKLHEIFKGSGVDNLLKTPFSPSDELSFYDHTEVEGGVMYIGSSTHGGHYVLHLYHA